MKKKSEEENKKDNIGWKALANSTARASQNITNPNCACSADVIKTVFNVRTCRAG